MSIQLEVNFAASAATVFNALMTSEGHSAFTGATATIDAAEGGAWSAYGGAIFGRNIEVIANQRVVQSWRAGNWAEAIHSVVHFELHAEGEGTRVVMTQAAFPDGEAEHLTGGWEKMYWGPLRAWLAAQ